MPYEIYKILHLFFVILMVFSWGISFVEKSKLASILGGIATLVIFVSGMGLMARLGIGHGEGWPLWIKLKMLFWFLLSVIVPILIKRVPGQKNKTIVGALGLLVILLYVVQYKIG